MSLLDDVSELLDAALEEPAAGHTLWSFHQKDLARPLEADEIVARIQSGQGVYAIELVFDDDLELFQRGDGRRIKSARDLHALMRDRAAPMRAPVPKATPPAPKAGRPTPLHGALLQPKKKS